MIANNYTLILGLTSWSPPEVVAVVGNNGLLDSALEVHLMIISTRQHWGQHQRCTLPKWIDNTRQHWGQHQRCTLPKWIDR